MGLLEGIADLAGGAIDLGGKVLGGTRVGSRIAANERNKKKDELAEMEQASQSYQRLEQLPPEQQEGMKKELDRFWTGRGLSQENLSAASQTFLSGGAFGGIPAGHEEVGRNINAEGKTTSVRTKPIDPNRDITNLQILDENITAAEDDPEMKQAFIEKRKQNPLYQKMQTSRLPQNISDYFKKAKQTKRRKKGKLGTFDDVYDYDEAKNYLESEYSFIPKDVLTAALNKHWDVEAGKESGKWRKYGPRLDTKPEAEAKGKATVDNVGTMRVITPEGVKGTIPVSEWESYKAQGYKKI